MDVKLIGLISVRTVQRGVNDPGCSVKKEGGINPRIGCDPADPDLKVPDLFCHRYYRILTRAPVAL